jgi:GNAT superfamily N-acetyltransferase
MATRVGAARPQPAGTPTSISAPKALEVCARGFALVRSLTNPYVVEGHARLWHLHDAPRARGDYRGDEWWACGISAADVDGAARERSRGRRFAVCTLLVDGDDEASLRDEYRALGYRLLRTEPLMVRGLARIPRPDPAIPIERVRSQAVADLLAKANRGRQMQPEHLASDSPLRRYVAWDGDEMVAWVGSVTVGDATYCDNMYVRADHRRRGIATAMLNRMLRDDRARGSRAAVLLASQMGALLYPTAGYRQIGTLFIYQPPRR